MNYANKELRISKKALCKQGTHYTPLLLRIHKQTQRLLVWVVSVFCLQTVFLLVYNSA